MLRNRIAGAEGLQKIARFPRRWRDAVHENRGVLEQGRRQFAHVGAVRTDGVDMHIGPQIVYVKQGARALVAVQIMPALRKFALSEPISVSNPKRDCNASA